MPRKPPKNPGIRHGRPMRRRSGSRLQRTWRSRWRRRRRRAPSAERAARRARNFDAFGGAFRLGQGGSFVGLLLGLLFFRGLFWVFKGARRLLLLGRVVLSGLFGSSGARLRVCWRCFWGFWVFWVFRRLLCWGRCCWCFGWAKVWVFWVFCWVFVFVLAFGASGARLPCLLGTKLATGCFNPLNGVYTWKWVVTWVTKLSL